MLTLTAALLALNSAMTRPVQDHRLDWWHEAKFGLFIHWGLYSILEGEYGGKTNYAEWIRTSAHIPLEEYDQLVHRFNPVKFDAKQWADYAKNAGMEYVVITTKHHDGFNLFDSKYSDFDVMSTPFKRDIMKELSTAVRADGLKMGWYHSIMDWHHPDYLPRRDWEKDRPTAGADFDRYDKYLENEVSQLLTDYGPISVMWFDGEWESTWNHTYGQHLYDLCRKLQPNVIVNNRVDVGRGGMGGMSDSKYAGDYGTPEQEIPATGLPGVAWESCITMNANWGWNRADHNWKSTDQLLEMLADIVSKGGNLLLNVGPKPDGTFPDEAVTRLKEIGDWMKYNGEAVYGTTASPFKSLPFGRATQKGNVVYLYLFDVPKDGKLVVPGLATKVLDAEILAVKPKPKFKQSPSETVLTLPDLAGQRLPVVKLTLDGPPVVIDTPTIPTESGEFYKTPHQVKLETHQGYELRYTLDGSDPTATSKLSTGEVQVTRNCVLKAAYFHGKDRISGIASQAFTQLKLQPAVMVPAHRMGLTMKEYLGNFDKMPDVWPLEAAATKNSAKIDIDGLLQPEHVARVFEGFIQVPADGLYTFRLTSDDGSKLYVGGKEVVDNDGLHGAVDKSGSIALAMGMHAFRLEWFNATGGKELNLEWKTEGGKFTAVPDRVFVLR